MIELSYEKRYELYKKGLVEHKNNFIKNMQEQEILKQKRKTITQTNKKLFAYWTDMLDNNVSKKRREQVISALMFGNTKRYKEIVR